MRHLGFPARVGGRVDRGFFVHVDLDDREVNAPIQESEWGLFRFLFDLLPCRIAAAMGIRSRDLQP